jgi:hypothetical protein
MITAVSSIQVIGAAIATIHLLVRGKLLGLVTELKRDISSLRRR